MVTNKINAGIRLDAEDIAELDKLSKQLGLSKNIVMSQALRLFSVTTHKGASTLEKTTNSNSCSCLFSASTLPKSASTLQGLDAKAVLLEAKTAWLKVENRDNEQVLFYDGAIWLVGKTTRGSQDLLKKLLEYPVELFAHLADSRGAYALADCRKALARWNELKAMEHINEVTDSRCTDEYSFFDLAVYFFSDKHFQNLKQKAIKAIEAYKASLQEAVAVVEPVHAEVVADAIEVCQTPHIEEVLERSLTKAEFCKEVDLDATSQHYNMACQDAKTDAGYIDKNGDRWFTVGSRNNRRWNKTALAPALVEAIT